MLRPSLVYGRGGASAALFATLAAQPVRPRLESGPLRPIHVDDVAEAVAALLDARGPLPPVVDAVGPVEMPVEEVLARLRHWLGLPPAHTVAVPAALAGATAGILEGAGSRLVTRDSLRMLVCGASASPAAFMAETGIAPVALEEGLAREPALPADRWAARLRLVRPVLRFSLAALWIATGVVSLGLYPVSKSLELLAAVGLTGIPAQVALHGAALWDLGLGVALAARVRPRLVGALQIATTLTFTAILTAFLPNVWLHPFGPLTKNLPVIAATLAMMALED